MMSLGSVFAGFLVLAGGLSLACGMEAAVCGDEPRCEVSPAISPANCLPAYAVPPKADWFIEDTPAGCINYYYLWCWPDPAIGCWTQGYGLGDNGECEHGLNETSVGMCFEGYNLKILQLQYHRSECEFFDGVCQCIWLIGGAPTEPWQVCDCAQF